MGGALCGILADQSLVPLSLDDEVGFRQAAEEMLSMPKAGKAQAGRILSRQDYFSISCVWPALKDVSKATYALRMRLSSGQVQVCVCVRLVTPRDSVKCVSQDPQNPRKATPVFSYEYDSPPWSTLYALHRCMRASADQSWRLSPG